MALSITVHGQGTFTASMEEGPVTFTAAIASVGPQGAQGPAGAAGAPGVVAATAPITYNAGTQTVGISANPSFTSVSATTLNTTTLNLTTATFADATSQTTAFVGEAFREYLIARNNNGATIPKGSVVYLNGSIGNKPTVSLADASVESTSSRTIGITAEAIASNADGKVIISGRVDNLDTSAFTAGDVLYLSSSVPGGLQTTLPLAPLHGVVIGIVTRANPSVGSIEVFIQNYQELKELSDVAVADRTNNDGLFWETSSSTWRSKTVAEVLGYTPANGADYLAKASNLSDLASASIARTNLGLGTMAVETASDYLTKAGNLSGLASVSTARTNLGLGTMAVETASNYALLASPTFTGDPKAPTPATSDNDTSIATTAFVNEYAPAATTSTAGKVQLATEAQAQAKTSTTAVITADTFTNSQLNWAIPTTYTSYVSTGTFSALSLGARCQMTATAAGQYAIGHPSTGGVTQFLSTGTFYTECNFSKRIKIYGRMYGVFVANINCYYAFGRAFTTASTIGSPVAKGFGIRIQGTGAVELQVHNGTTLTNVTSTFTPTTLTTFDCLIDSLGDGTVNLYINGNLVATSSAGPVGTVSGQSPQLIQELSSTAASTQGAFWITGRAIYMA